MILAVRSPLFPCTSLCRSFSLNRQAARQRHGMDPRVRALRFACAPPEDDEGSGGGSQSPAAALCRDAVMTHPFGSAAELPALAYAADRERRVVTAGAAPHR